MRMMLHKQAGLFEIGMEIVVNTDTENEKLRDTWPVILPLHFVMLTFRTSGKPKKYLFTLADL
jgi:hypothetical protein